MTLDTSLLPDAPADEPTAADRAEPPARHRLLRTVVAAATAGAAAVHFGVTGEHWQEWWAYGVFFIVVSWLQVGWAVALLSPLPARLSKWLVGLGAVGQLGVIALWAVTRTSGLPFGPDSGSPEAVGYADVLCCVFEAVAGLGGLLLLWPNALSRLGRLGRPLAVGLTSVVVLAVAGTSAVAFTPSFASEHHHDAAGGDTGAHAGYAGHTEHTAATGDIPAGWTAGCHTHDATSSDATGTASGLLAHGPGTCTDAPVTPQQRAAAEQLVKVTTAAVTSRFPTLAAAEKAGYKPVNITGPLWHVANPAYMTDGRLLDPNRVESLVYYVPDQQHTILLGAMYILDPIPGVSTVAPMPGGALTSWHSHSNLCVDAVQFTAMDPRPDGSCPPGSHVGLTPQMMHVWTVPYDGGPFAEISVPSLIKAVQAALIQRAQQATPS